MTDKKFIESGVLELYVLGRLSHQEMAEVERMCRKFPAVKRELEEIENAIEVIDRKYAMTPPSTTKEKLFAQVGTSGDSVPSVSKPADARNYSWLMAASVIIAITSLAVAVFFYQKWSTKSQQYDDLLAQNSLMAQELNQVKNSLEENEELLAIATDQTTQRILLSATKEGSEAKAVAYWNVATNAVYLDPGNLPLPGDQQDYQLWAIVEGKPVDMGIISLGEKETLQKMNSVTNATAFAITLEPKGGKRQPTLEKMVVLGNVSA